MWVEISQNQLGIKPMRLALEKSKYWILLCDFSQGGKEGPKPHERILRKYNWNGGIQLTLTFKVNELSDKNKTDKLLSFEK
jgi:hypothetical protein